MELFNTCFESAKDYRALAYYSHLLPIIISLIIGTVVVLYARNRDKAILFYSFTISLCLWLAGDLIVWTSNNYNLVAAFWSPLDYLNVLFYLFIFLFAVYDFTTNKRARIIAAVLGALATLPPFLITLAGVAVYEFDEPNCEMAGNEWLALYKLGFEAVVILLILLIGIISLSKLRMQQAEFKRIMLTTLSTVIFLTIFAGSEFISTYTEIYEINLYALFTLPVFILLLAVSIFEMKTFRLQLESFKVFQALFILFIIVTLSNLFVSDDVGEFVISGTGAIITLGFGMLVLRGAEREKEQRVQIEKLAKNLEQANARLKALDKQKSEFVSIASHQLRSPLTAIRGYASLLLDGSFGGFDEKMREPLSRIEQSTKLMAVAIEDYLNVSRIESGNMKFNFDDFNLRDEVEYLCDDLRASAEGKGLQLIFKTNLNSRGVVHLDVGKTVQIVQNIIQNSIKYTEQGSITVLVRDDVVRKRICIDVSDTGIGMSKNGLQTIFQKFQRAENANAADIHGTGLGLYVALKMAQAMMGTITAHSEGIGQGSRFTIEFPLAM